MPPVTGGEPAAQREAADEIGVGDKEPAEGDGVGAASFLKEVIRRSVLESLRDGPALTAVTGAQLARALDDLLDAAQGVTRALHGVGVDPADLRVGGALSRGPGGGGWVAYGPRGMVRRRFR